MTADLLAALQQAAVNRARAERGLPPTRLPEPSRNPVRDDIEADDPEMRYTPRELDAMADEAADREAGW